MAYFADTSALVRVYLADEPEAAELRALLRYGDAPVYASDVARIEACRAIATAARSGRMPALTANALIEAMTADLGGTGPITTLRTDPDASFARARELVLDYPLRTLDAIHLAVAEVQARPLAHPEPLVFVTRDATQRRVAEERGFETA